MWNVWEYTGPCNIIISSKSMRMIRIIDVISGKLNAVRYSICDMTNANDTLNLPYVNSHFVPIYL